MSKRSRSFPREPRGKLCELSLSLFLHHPVHHAAVSSKKNANMKRRFAELTVEEKECAKELVQRAGDHRAQRTATLN